MRTYEVDVHFPTVKRVKVQAKDRDDAIRKASTIAARRYGAKKHDMTLRVPFHPEDEA